MTLSTSTNYSNYQNRMRCDSAATKIHGTARRSAEVEESGQQLTYRRDREPPLPRIFHSRVEWLLSEFLFSRLNAVAEVQKGYLPLFRTYQDGTCPCVLKPTVFCPCWTFIYQRPTGEVWDLVLPHACWRYLLMTCRIIE